MCLFELNKMSNKIQFPVDPYVRITHYPAGPVLAELNSIALNKRNIAGRNCQKIRPFFSLFFASAGQKFRHTFMQQVAAN